MSMLWLGKELSDCTVAELDLATSYVRNTAWTYDDYSEYRQRLDDIAIWRDLAVLKQQMIEAELC